MLARFSHMNIFKFRVILDTEEDVFRDIEMPTEGSFEAFHQAILRAFDWEEGELASFYKSNETWDRGQEIPLMDMGGPAEGAPGSSMATTFLNQLVTKPDEKLVYVYDFFRMWCFYIELQSVSKAKSGILYPHLALSYGEAPNYTSKEVDLLGDFTMPGEDAPAKGSGMTGDPEIDEYLKGQGGEEDDNEPGFEQLDDLDEFI